MDSLTTSSSSSSISSSYTSSSSSQKTLQFSFYSEQDLLLMADEFVLPRQKARGNPYPRRGQIKAKIFGAIASSVISIASKVGEKKRKNSGGDSGSSGCSSPASDEEKI